jgi:hypothetical protein
MRFRGRRLPREIIDALPPKEAKRLAVSKRVSSLEAKFDKVWRQIGGRKLESEVLLVPGRKWRYDRVDPESMVVAELHGGIWVKGRHTSGSGFSADRRKMNAAQELGYLVYELTPQDVTPEYLRRIKSFMESRREQREAKGQVQREEAGQGEGGGTGEA